MIATASQPRDATNTANPSSPTSIRCRFFELPAELRDAIYRYALSYDNGLITAPHPRSTPTLFVNNEKIGPCNKDPKLLRYVCRQIFQETKGIMLKVNTITFKGAPTAYQKPAVQLTRVTGLDYFLDCLTHPDFPALDFLTKVVVQYKLRYWSCKWKIFRILDDDSLLSQVCRQKPRLTVIVRFRSGCVPLSIKTYIMVTHVFAELLRGTRLEIPHHFFDNFEAEVEMIRNRLLSNERETPLPPNLRVSVVHEEALTQAALQQSFEGCAPLQGFDEAQVMDLMQFTRQTFEAGI
tara:strand:- start:3385 stop:4266 length:882 start_codon:yes stop_codon:yes gene_type:complete